MSIESEAHGPTKRLSPKVAMISILRTRRRRWLVGTMLVLIVAVVATGVAAREWLWSEDVTIGEPPPPEVRLSPEEQAFYDYVSPRLRVLGGEARALATLGAEKSRNIFELQSHGDNVTKLIGEINGFAEANGTPDRFVPVMATYREGAVKARRGMDEAQQGFVRFDWDRVAGAVTLFTEGADGLDRAADQMDEAVGVASHATPVVTGDPGGVVRAL